MGLTGGTIADDLDAVGELHTLDEFWQLVVAVNPTPTFLGAVDQLEDHRERGLVQQDSLLIGWCGAGRVAKVLSIGFVVRKCFQCSAGKS